MSPKITLSRIDIELNETSLTNIFVFTTSLLSTSANTRHVLSVISLGNGIETNALDCGSIVALSNL